MTLPRADLSTQFESLVDRELQLVPVQPRWMDAYLAGCYHPQTRALMPREAEIRRGDLRRQIQETPGGIYPGDEASGRCPAYQFWMLLRHGPTGLQQPPLLRIAGGLSLRLGSGESIEQYYGHVGYHVFPAARGQRYSLRSCRLALPIFRHHGFRRIWLTCDPANDASRRTIESLGAVYRETVEVPESDPLYARGEARKCRFELSL